MKLKKVVRVCDSLVAEKSNKKRLREIKDSLREKLMDTESTEEAVQVAVDALQDEEPADVITAVVEVLSDVVDDLQEVADSRSRKSKRFKVKGFIKRKSDSEKGLVNVVTSGDEVGMSLLEDNEGKLILRDWNDTGDEFETGKTKQWLIEEIKKEAKKEGLRLQGFDDDDILSVMDEVCSSKWDDVDTDTILSIYNRMWSKF